MGWGEGSYRLAADEALLQKERELLQVNVLWYIAAN